MTRSASSLILLLGLAACTAQPPPRGPALAATARCIDSSQIVGRRVAAPDAVEFQLVGGTYRNRFASACPGLERLGTSAVVSVSSGGEGGRLCSGDRVKVYDPVEVRATGLQGQPECVLGEFVRL